MTKKNTDQRFTQLLQNDCPGKPNPAVEERLMYAFSLKSCNSRLRQNSFASFAQWIFSFKGIGLKTGLVSVMLFFTLINKQLVSESDKCALTDSLFTQRVLVADSTMFFQATDSIRKDSLQ